MIVNPKKPEYRIRCIQQMQSAAAAHGAADFNLECQQQNASSMRPSRRLSEQRAGAVIVNADPYFNIRRDQLDGTGGAMRFPPSTIARFVRRRADELRADIADALSQCRNLFRPHSQGEKPADLPVSSRPSSSWSSISRPRVPRPRRAADAARPRRRGHRMINGANSSRWSAAGRRVAARGAGAAARAHSADRRALGHRCGRSGVASAH